MDLSGLTDMKTTVPGIIVLVCATIVLITGNCTFDQWWMVALAVIGYISGGKLLLMNTKKGEGK